MSSRNHRHGRAVRAALTPHALRARGDEPCLVVPGNGRRSDTVTYAELAGRVEQQAEEYGVGRRLVLLEMATTVDAVVGFLAALAGRHPVVVTDPASDHADLVATFRPDLVVEADRSDGARSSVHHLSDRERPSVHDLHDELAVLMTTSGSTGAGKLVRLSRDAVTANAVSIATYLGLTAADRAVTSLPLHYCYGLSVLTSHLVAGASLVLTDASVVDPCFRTAMDDHDVTGLPGVPYTFELLERAGSRPLDVASLRYVTQAGGSLAPDRIVGLAERGRRDGWDLYVMYGQTEATARMAYLPPDLAAERPGAVGVAVPGGTIRIDADADGDGPPGCGEIVYAGPNVMMGYACAPDDLARGPELDELRTGDLGRIDDDGLLRVVGRRSRFLKIHGRRIDLDHLESVLGTRGRAVRCVGDDDLLVVARLADDGADAAGAADVAGAGPDPALHAEAMTRVSIPAGRVRAITVAEWPRTASGKIDAPALVDLAASTADPLPDGADGTQPDGALTVAGTFALVLGVTEVAPDATFAGLGGDSFSYVEASIRLEELFAEIPQDWHLTPVGALQRRLDERPEAPTVDRPARRRWVSMETSVVVRAIAITLIVVTHMRLYRLAGGAHTLLAVLGWNIARFQLLPADVPGRLRRAAATIGRVAVPTSAWIGLNMVLAGGYSVGALLLVNNYTGDAARRGGRWEYWYFEAFVQIMAVVAVVFSIGAVRRAERRAPFLFALGVLGLTLLLRFDVLQWGGAYNEIFRTHTVACFVALGWCAQRARDHVQRAVVTILLLVTTFGYFASVGYTGAGQVDREWRIVVLVGALVWLPTLRLPSPVAAVVARVAAASMWIFLLHWQVWPLFTPWLDRHVAVVATMAVGVGVWAVVETVQRRWADRRRRTGRARPAPIAERDPVADHDLDPIEPDDALVTSSRGAAARSSGRRGSLVSSPSA